MKRFILISALLLVFTGSTVVASSTVTNTLNVSATVPSACTFGTIGTLDFGSLDSSFTAGTTDKNGTSTINYTCVTGTVGVMTLDQGANPNTGSTDTAPLRRLKNGSSNYISYAINQTGSGTVWGNTAGTGVNLTADGTQHSVTAYGVATHANVPAGTYSDTVTITITF